MNWWHFLSVLGGLSVTGPLGIAIAGWLLAGKSWRLTLSWCCCFGLGMAMVVLTKVAFIGWGIGSASLEFGGISGHAMRAGAVYPVAAYLALRHAGASLQRMAVLAGVVLALLIGVSRLEVRAHSVSEVVSGSLLGLAVAAVFIRQASLVPSMALSRVLVALCLPILLMTPRLEPVPTEEWMTGLALYLSGRDEPFTRHMWGRMQLTHAGR
ncbi:phosphatase PAP2 family protein [Rugamonas sp. CCM 8940]|uniref:phosphatase PAP2 family protein n=1 Tax=Rugamonas sp. CCM 8940 TaxID=2765359 RepID=UPI0018F3038D|nr:phosphatase PAP2 family protein [Rugamonas sp. CCM 8940]MBJ7310628.1 phosphatase PAP2 family protein [Rugamonas sp. CCM 8940]